MFLDKAGKIKNDKIRAYFDKELPSKISEEEDDFERGLYKALQEHATPPCPDSAPPHGETLRKTLDDMMAL